MAGERLGAVSGIREKFGRSPEIVDRTLMGTCAAVWLLVLGFAVAAGVALVDMGRGHPQAEGGADTPWVLYTVIGVSAAVIIGAVPLLLRARNGASGSKQAGPEKPEAPRLERHQPGYPGSAQAKGTTDTPGRSSPLVDRLWLRCGLGILTGLGAAYLAVCIATHLMAAGLDGAAWGVYGVAAVITAGMIAIPAVLYRQFSAERGERAAD